MGDKNNACEQSSGPQCAQGQLVLPDVQAIRQHLAPPPIREVVIRVSPALASLISVAVREYRQRYLLNNDCQNQSKALINKLNEVSL